MLHDQDSATATIDRPGRLPSERLASLDQWHSISQFLYREARTLDREELRTWLERFISADILYRLFTREERFRRDAAPPRRVEVKFYEDDYRALEMRVRQFETGLQRMMDPAQRMRRVITNVEVYTDDGETFDVCSLASVTRSRRQYERETTLFFRQDMIRAEPELKLVSRSIELDQRVTTAKNLLFFI